MLENGFIKLYRSMLKWEWYDDINTKVVFLHLLLTVSIEDSKWHGIEIKRGSRVASFEVLSKETKLTFQQVRTAIKHLETTGEVTRSAHSKFTVFSVNNYDKFQTVTSNITNNQQTTNKQLTNNQQQYKKVKEDKESKNINIYLEIISYLNEKAGTTYRHQSKDTQKYINARLNEGYTVEDFRTVIDNKCSEWLEDEKMQKYLRPSTLFGTKFENYLQEKKEDCRSEYDKQFDGIVKRY